MDPYTNPPNSKEILNKLSTVKNSQEAEELINQYFPGWLVFSANAYSRDYTHLQKNWKHICEMIKTQPQKIVFVADIKFDDEHSTINAISEFMVKNGYCIRRVGEFIVCPVCEKAIPCIQVWHLLKEKGLPVPAKWSNKCSCC